MEWFARFAENLGEMAATLRLVPPEVQAGHPDMIYLVSRTRFVEVGRPYVIAAVADAVLADERWSADAEPYSAEEMASDRSLALALRSWRAGNLDLLRRERRAVELVEASYRASMMRAARRHPSMAGR